MQINSDPKRILITGFVLAVVVIIGWAAFSPSGVQIPLLGRLKINVPNFTGRSVPAEEQTVENLVVDGLFGYRSSPQAYAANVDPIEIRVAVNNSTEETQSGQFEIKFYKFASLWDTKTNDVPFGGRFFFVNAQPDDPTKVFSEEALANIVHTEELCDSTDAQNSSYAPPCYHDPNPNDGSHDYGGYTLASKPSHVNISSQVELGAGQTTNLLSVWTPTECGYFQVIVQPFGEQDIMGEAYVRVSGCSKGQVLGVQAGDELPATADGTMTLVSAFGLFTAGLLIHKGLKGFLLAD